MSHRMHHHGLPGWIADLFGVGFAVVAGLAGERAVLVLTCVSLASGALYHLGMLACHLWKTRAEVRRIEERRRTPWGGFTYDQLEGRN